MPGRRRTQLDLSEIGERGLIRRFRVRSRRRGPKLLAGIGDDAALTTLSSPQIITCDLLIEDIHFQRRWHPWRLLGRKALAVNLSDIAAMGGIPRFALLGLGLPARTPAAGVSALHRGFLEMAKAHQVELIGGDTCASEKIILAVTVLGEEGRRPSALRSGARPGDLIFVSGTLGDAAWGLELLNRGHGSPRHPAVRRLLDPSPRVKLGQKLAGVVSAMIDLSDGLLCDLGHLLEESGEVAAQVELARLPLSPWFSRHFRVQGALSGKALALAVAGGEDYELLFTAPPDRAGAVARAARAAGVAVTVVGRLDRSRQPGIQLVDPKGERVPLPSARFEHFPERA